MFVCRSICGLCVYRLISEKTKQRISTVHTGAVCNTAKAKSIYSFVGASIVLYFCFARFISFSIDVKRAECAMK